MMGTSAMNTLRMEFATLRERNTRVYARGTAERREAPAGPQGPAAGAEARALPAALPADPRGPSRLPRRCFLPGPPAPRSRQVRVLDDELDVLVRQLGDAHRGLVGVRHGRPAPAPPPARRPAPARPRPLAAAASRRTPPVRPRPAPPSAAGAPPKRVRARLGCGFIGAGEGSGAARSHSRAVGSVLTGSGSAPPGS